MRFVERLFTVFLAVFLPLAASAAGKASHVVLIVWDGMRPDFVRPDTTPTLSALAREGVTFAHHHPVYVSSTEVNGAALATGVYPGQNGVIGNNEFRPALNPRRKIMTADPAILLQSHPEHPCLAFATVAETVRKAGRTAAIAGAKPVALLADCAPELGAVQGVCVYEGHVLPAARQASLLQQLGDFPAAGITKAARDTWTTRALVGPLWETELPAFSLLWLSEPDFAQHTTGPGSPASLAAIKNSDDNLARVLQALKQKGLRESTDIIIVSDHGFSTILQTINVPQALNTNGFTAVQELPADGASPGDILVVGNGGSVFLYVQGHSPQVIERAVRCLQTQPFCGVIFTRKPLQGTFTLEQARVNSTDAPDIVFSLAWKPGKSSNGTEGLIYSASGEYHPGQGMHGTLSPFDLHNTCIAAGPDFARGFRDELPTGNIDIAPTLLWILGISPARPLSGRVLSEAMPASGLPACTSQSRHLQTSCPGTNYLWRQSLDSSEVNGVTYFERGESSRLGTTNLLSGR